MKADNKTEMLTIRIDKETTDKLQVMADSERRSLSDFIRLELEKLVMPTKKGK